jgi:D-beta-D-heptose 7-phosphate kinase / D-beta-D-heptose 1-phosphate adenosyltransferase
VNRVCPDAPVPVMDAEDELARPGGAGLAAALLAADGADVTLVAPVAGDAAGSSLRDLLELHGVRLVGLGTWGRTREKVRVRARGQSLLRLDYGSACPPRGPLPPSVRALVRSADAVLVSDYAGGVTSADAVRDVLTATTNPIVWDPHVRGAAAVPGVALVTPNLEEARSLSGADPDGPGQPTATGRARSAFGAAQLHADRLARHWQARAVCVTLGTRGALLSYGSGSPLVVPARAVDGDACGAGDRFAATVTERLARGDVVSTAVQAAVVAASKFVAAGGAGAVPERPFDGSSDLRPHGTATGLTRVDEVRRHGGTVVATGGCFDLLHAGHVALLQAARRLGDALVVCLNSDDSVRRLKGPDRPLVPLADRIRVLQALECVDAVAVFDESTPEAVLRSLQPDIWTKGGDYALHDLPEAAVVAEWGGQTVVLPYLEGRSTSGLIGVVRGRDG